MHPEVRYPDRHSQRYSVQVLPSTAPWSQVRHRRTYVKAESTRDDLKSANLHNLRLTVAIEWKGTEESESSAWFKDPCKFRHGFFMVKPMRGLSCCDHVDGVTLNEG